MYVQIFCVVVLVFGYIEKEKRHISPQLAPEAYIGYFKIFFFFVKFYDIACIGETRPMARSGR